MSSMFPPLKPTLEQQVHYQKIAQRLLDSTVQHYQLFNFHYHRQMNRKRWKAVKSREYMTVYKERDPLPIEHCDVGKDWKDPKLLVATGSIVGQLDDVMYGVVTPDAESMLLKAAITKNRLVGGAVLHQIQGPTIHEPFRFLGVKWFVMAPPTTLNGMIWSRDVVFVESTGITTLPNGDRIGYQLMQSVDIPGYGHLEQHSIVRGRLSSCSIFKQLANGTVDVYVRGYVEAFGKVMDSVALKTAASGFLSSWNSVGCAQYKKLMWCVQHRRSSDYAADVTHNHRSCAACNKRFGKFSSAGMCTLCRNWMCSRCRVVSKLRDVDSELSIEEKDAIICKSCVERVDEQDTFEIATKEILSGRFTPKRSKPVIKLWSFQRGSTSRSRDSVPFIPSDDDSHAAPHRNGEGVQLFDPTQLYNSSKSRAHSSDSEEPSSSANTAPSFESIEDGHADYYYDHHPRRSRSPDLTPSEFDDEDDEEYEHLAGKLNYQPKHFRVLSDSNHHRDYNHHQQQQYQEKKQASSSSEGPSNAAEQLWKQLQNLHAATEQTYQMTLQTTDTHIKRSGGSKTALFR